MSVVINGTTGISGIDGTAAAPAVQGNDTNTGIFFPANDTIAFAEGGTEVMRIDSSGNLGIGTSSPQRNLDVNGSMRFSSGGVIECGSTLNTYLAGISGSNGYWAVATNGAERVRIDSAGRMTIPNQPMVQATRNTGSWFTLNNYFIFNTAAINVGNHYNTSTGLFTCPVAGYYRVTSSILMGLATGVGYYYLYRNGSSYQAGAYLNAYSTSIHVNLASSWIVNASINDTLGIFVTSGTDGVFGTGWNSLTIELVG